MRFVIFLTLALLPGTAIAQELLTGEESVGCDSDYGAGQYAPMLKKYATSPDLDNQIEGIGCMVMQDNLPVTVVAKGDGWVQGHVHPTDGDAFDEWFPDGMLYDPKTGKIFTSH